MISQFQSLINGKQNKEPEFQMVSAILFDALLILENPLPLFNVHFNRFLPTNGKHPRSSGIEDLSYANQICIKRHYVVFTSCLFERAKPTNKDARGALSKGGL